MTLNILLTGASGAMGSQVLKQLSQEPSIRLNVLALDTRADRKALKPYRGQKNLQVIRGDIRDYDIFCQAVKDIDLVLHMGALVSPAADSRPKQTMEINYGGTLNLIEAIAALGQNEKTHFVLS